MPPKRRSSARRSPAARTTPKRTARATPTRPLALSPPPPPLSCLPPPQGDDDDDHNDKDKEAVVASQLDEGARVFGISPLAFVDGLVNAVGDFVCDAVDALEMELKNLPSLHDHHAKVEACSDRLLEFLCQQIDHHFDNFELYVANNVFALPPEPEPTLPSPVDDKEVQEADDELAAVRRRVLGATRRHAELRMQQALLSLHIRAAKRVKGRVEDIHAQLADSESSASLNGVRELKRRFADLEGVCAEVSKKSKKIVLQKPQAAAQHEFQQSQEAMGAKDVSDMAALKSIVGKDHGKSRPRGKAKRGRPRRP